MKYDLVCVTGYSKTSLYIKNRMSKKTSKKEITKTIFDSVNHTRFPKEDHLPG
jgi:hypothetical protein